MTTEILLALILGITFAALVVTVGGFIIFARWSKKDQFRRNVDAELAEVLRQTRTSRKS